MRTALLLIAMLSLPSLAWADGPSDLRSSLDRLQGHSPLKVQVTYVRNQETTSFLNPVVGQTALQLRLEEDGSVLHIDWGLPELDAVVQEGRKVSSSETAKTPIRDAVKDLDASTLERMLNQADVLSQLLAKSKFGHESTETFNGKPTKSLIYSFEPTIRPDHLGRVSRVKSTLKIWVGEDGLPLASETLTDYEGRHNRFFGRFHSKTVVKTTYQVFNQRLIVASRNSDEMVNDSGEKFKTNRILSIVAAS